MLSFTVLPAVVTVLLVGSCSLYFSVLLVPVHTAVAFPVRDLCYSLARSSSVYSRGGILKNCAYPIHWPNHWVVDPGLSLSAVRMVDAVLATVLFAGWRGWQRKRTRPYTPALHDRNGRKRKRWYALPASLFVCDVLLVWLRVAAKGARTQVTWRHTRLVMGARRPG